MRFPAAPCPPCAAQRSCMPQSCQQLQHPPSRSSSSRDSRDIVSPTAVIMVTKRWSSSKTSGSSSSSSSSSSGRERFALHAAREVQYGRIRWRVQKDCPAVRGRCCCCRCLLLLAFANAPSFYLLLRCICPVLRGSKHFTSEEWLVVFVVLYPVSTPSRVPPPTSVCVVSTDTL